MRIVYLIAVAVLISLAHGPSAFAQRTGSAVSTLATSLESAYRREFAFLEAEKRALQARLRDQRVRTSERLKQAKSEISTLQGRVVGAAGLAERLEEQVLTADRDVEVLETGESVAEDILMRAATALGRGGRELPEIDGNDRAQVLSQLSRVFEESPALLREQATVRIEEGAYFDAAGNKVEGDIVRVGNIATYGLAKGAEGVLAPAGEMRLKLWETAGGASAAVALADGSASGTLPIFLYESLETGVQAKVDKSVMDIIRTGGVIAWVIVGLGGVALLMVFARAIFLTLASRGSSSLLADVMTHLDAEEPQKARAEADAANTAMGRVLTATLSNVDLPRDTLEDVVAEAVLHEQPALSRFGSSILVAAAVSPLLGLLGTVTGMISTFDVITEFGTGNPKLLSGGISDPLVTTELGLVVAIPALLLGHMLSGWSDAIRDKLDAAALAAVNRSLGLPTDSPDSVPRAAARTSTRGAAA